MVRRTGLAAVFAVLAMAVTVHCADLKNPAEILKKNKARVLGLQSYSYTLVSKGWDFELDKTADATKSLTGEAKDNMLTKRFTKDVDTDKLGEPKIMKYKIDYQFMKPFYLKMKIVQSDYVPSIIIGSVMTYNPKKNPDKFTIAAKLVGIGIPRDITSESGNFTHAHFITDLVQIDNLSKDSKPILEGMETVNGRKAYKIAFKFDKKNRPKEHKVDMKAWGIPKEIQPKIKDELNAYAHDKQLGKIVYYIDAQTFDFIAKQSYLLDGKEYFRKEWQNLKTNQLSEKDF